MRRLISTILVLVFLAVSITQIWGGDYAGGTYTLVLAVLNQLFAMEAE